MSRIARGIRYNGRRLQRSLNKIRAEPEKTIIGIERVRALDRKLDILIKNTTRLQGDIKDIRFDTRIANFVACCACIAILMKK